MKSMIQQQQGLYAERAVGDTATPQLAPWALKPSAAFVQRGHGLSEDTLSSVITFKGN